MSHLILFDEVCPLCQNAVRRIISLDRKKLFLFAPLSGKTAQKFSAYTNQNSLVLIEAPEERIWLRARASFRIFWLLGGPWKLLGWLCYLPGLDLFYLFIARHRHWLKPTRPVYFSPEERERIIE